MGKIIIVTFAFMAFAFYELSGGDAFVPIADEKRALLAKQHDAERVAEAAAKAAQEEKLAASGIIAPEPPHSATAGLVLASARTVAQTGDNTLAVQPQAAAALEADKAEALTETADSTEVKQEVAPTDIREVTAARVNMRGGPGQNFAVLAKLTAGDRVEILQDPGDGWVKLRTEDGDRVGWMADFLLTASNN